MAANMTAILIAILVLLTPGAAVNVYMQIRVNRRLAPGERPWDSRIDGSYAVGRKYGELFPESKLPVISRCFSFLFWVIVAVAAAMYVWKSGGIRIP